MKLRRLIQIEDRRLSILERRYQSRIAAALKKQGQNYIKTGKLGNEVFEALSKMYETVSFDYLQRQFSWLEQNIKKDARFFMGWKLWTAEQIAGGLRARANAIDDTTGQWIRDAEARNIEAQIAEGITTGQTTETLKEAVQYVTDGRIGKNRARVIARTEMGQAVNDAKSKSSDDWEKETGERLGKFWVHRGAKDPRSWHMALDTGVPIPKKQPFMVANPDSGIVDYMDYPHDDSASAENVVNCGCTIIYTRWDEN